MTSLAHRKGVITRQKNALGALEKELMHLRTPLNFPTGDQLRLFIMDQQAAHIHAAVQLEALIGKLESAVEKFAQCVDEIADVSDQDMELCGKIISDGNDGIESAQSLHLHIKGNISVLQNRNADQPTLADVQEPITVKVDIPDNGSIQSLLPTFTGKVWEWDNFWHIFNENVHKKNFSNLKKFSYLNASIKGEAASSISRFNMTDDNYVLAVDFLQKKYGDPERLITNLYHRLGTTKPQSSSTKDQRVALDQIYALINQLEQKKEHMDSTLVLNSVLAKFSERYQEKALSKKIDTKEPWTMKLLLATMDKLISKDELISSLVSREAHHTKKHDRHDSKNDFKKPSKSEDNNKTPFGCCYCNETDHRADDCPVLRNPKERADFLRKNGRCLNCTSTKHQLKDCKSGGCRKCNKKHHTSTCFGNSNLPSSSTPAANSKGGNSYASSNKVIKKESNNGKKNSAVSARQHFTADNEDAEEPLPQTEEVVLHLHRDHEHITHRSKVIILTGEAQMLDPKTQELRSVQILLDTGSELSFINSSFADELELPIVGQRSIKVHTFGSTHPTMHTCDMVTSHISDAEGRVYDFTLLKHNVLTSALPQAQLSEEDWNFIYDNRVVLSRDEAFTHLKPQILLGCDYLWSLLNTGKEHIELPSGLLLIPSRIGHLITGKQEHTEDDTTHVHTIYQSLSMDQEAQKWENFLSLETTGVEEFGGTKADEKETINQQVMSRFKQTIQRKGDGYHVRLPWKEDHDPLPDNRAIAHRRLESVIRTYSNNPEILRQYDQTFQDQLEKGIIEEVDEQKPCEGIKHYLAHSAVITPHKETTKMRVVFDASAHFKNSPCLNDVLHQGPLILPEMIGMLIRFRLNKIAMISDVEKAFLQVRLQDIDRDATRFLWLRDTRHPLTPENIVTYKYTRVTFGLNTSPFLLAATIDYHLNNVMDDTLRTYAEEIALNLYVDNLLQGAEDHEEALRKYQTAKQIFNDMHMNLREFISNNPDVNNGIEDGDRAANTRQKVLGITWDTESDTMLLKSAAPVIYEVTKRNISRQIASIFDPLGWWVPLLLPAKLFLQEVWSKSYDWDDTLPEEMTTTWTQMMKEISIFSKSLPRNVRHQGEEPHILVSFADASELAMGTCSYLVGTQSSHLLMAKSKLPSAKVKMTMPKLEMNALAMTTRITKYILEQIGNSMPIAMIFVLSDSQIALNWTKKIPEKNDAGVLVRNRVKEIRSIASSLQPPVRFGYVNTKENPADIASRGVELTKTNRGEFANHMWWTGPAFLTKPCNEWDRADLFSIPEPTGEDRIETTYAVTDITDETTSTELLDISRFSTLTKAIRVMANVLRFVKKSSHTLAPEVFSGKLRGILHNVNRRKTITSLDMDMALKVIVLQHQSTIDTTSRKSAKDLNLQRDNIGIWRCEGRMARSDLDSHSKSPIFIAPKSALARLIIVDRHSVNHPGMAQTIASVREHYWIPKLRQQVRSIITKCIPCQRFNNLPYGYPKMSSLPAQRVCRSRPFEHIGLDYFGPLSVSKGDGQTATVYGCIFTCMTTRLVHLEVAQDLSTESFINAIRRFYSRRGVPASITSDNAPTFVLGEAILHEVMQKIKETEEIGTLMANKAIDWRFITPYAPWQGGFYERLIKTIKHALYKSIGRLILTEDQLRTVIIEVEASVNSRPLTYQEAELDDQPILRPIDFLQKDIVISFPLEDIELNQEDPTYQTTAEVLQFKTRRDVETALKYSHAVVEKFWMLWKTQYLTSLREHHKTHMNDKKGSAQQPRVGSTVLLLDSNIPRNHWRMARISKLKPNSEGIVREVEVQTSNRRTLRRPVNLLVPLEIDEMEKNQTVNPDIERETEEEKLTERYNLRRLPRINYEEEEEVDGPDAGPLKRSTKPLLKGALQLITIMCMVSIASGAPFQHAFGNSSANVSCLPGGVVLHTKNVQLLEVCVDNYCAQRKHPMKAEEFRFPAESVLHAHMVTWKMSDGNEVVSATTECQPSSFCENVQCIICTSLIFNPECWPMGAILGLALTFYCLITICYVFLYVPFVVGTPARIGCTIGVRVFSCMVRNFMMVLRRIWTGIRRRGNSSRFKRALQGGVALLAISEACQKINVFSHSSTICTRSVSGYTKCRVEATEVIKINPYQQEACIKIVSNTSTLSEIRMRWKTLALSCEPETLMYTRHTEYRIIDSKRCPHTGSCIRDKCASINESTLVPELEHGNNFPGNTYCSESCGGPGCDCFYLSSGCLFYRIYLAPMSEPVYEIFKCTRWEEQVEVEVSQYSYIHKQPEITVRQLRPNIPQEIGSMTVTLSSLAIPPLPLLHTHFVTDGNNTALWKANKIPPLQCTSPSTAMELDCSVYEDCICTPAENSVICRCNELNITSRFNSVQNRLPINMPSVTFSQKENGSVLAAIPNMVTAEIILNFNEELSVVSDVTEDTCTIEDTIITGCYTCRRGAFSLVTCTSTKVETIAEVDCRTASFAIPCTESGHSTRLLFNLNMARIRLTCTVSCGSRKKNFGISGILKYSTTLESSLRRMQNGESNVLQDIALPDFGHIIDIYLQWYKTVIFAVAGTAVALVITYLVLSTCGLTVLMAFTRFILKLIYITLSIVLSMICMVKSALFRGRPQEKSEEKLL